MVKRIAAALVAVCMLWVGLSWADIAADNSLPSPAHSQQNFFIVAFGR